MVLTLYVFPDHDQLDKLVDNDKLMHIIVFIQLSISSCAYVCMQQEPLGRVLSHFLELIKIQEAYVYDFNVNF